MNVNVYVSAIALYFCECLLLFDSGIVNLKNLNKLKIINRERERERMEILNGNQM